MGASKFRGLGRVLGLWVKPRQREIAKHQTKLPAEMFLHGFDDGISGAANRALIVAIFDQGDGSIRVALDVIGRTDRNLQTWAIGSGRCKNAWPLRAPRRRPTSTRTSFLIDRDRRA